MFKRIFLLISLLLVPTVAVAADCPIIFIHGHKSEARPEGSDEHPNYKDLGGWGTWFPRRRDGSFDYHTAMTRIIGIHYNGYSAGDPLHCDKDSTPRPTGGETRKIYNFSYYRPDGGHGAIGSNDSIECAVQIDTQWIYESGSWQLKYYFAPNNLNDPRRWQGYEDAISGDSWAENLTNFIEDVLIACYGSNWQNNPNASVDIVAHSMGGLVARSAIKYYYFSNGGSVKNRVRKLLCVATPNHPFQYEGDEWWYLFVTTDFDWMKRGEDWEMDVDNCGEPFGNVYFRDVSSGVEGEWCDLLGYNNLTIAGMATIAGNRKNKKKFGFLAGPDDGVVYTSQVHLSSGVFNPIVFASHGHSEPQDYVIYEDIGSSGELALTECTYTEEFIKNWLIDDDVSHNGAQLTGAGDLFFWPTLWDSFEVRVHASVDDYHKALVYHSVIFDVGGNVVMSRAFPIYQYQKSAPGVLWGDPVFSTSNSEFPSTAIYLCVNYLYDMHHAIRIYTDTLGVVRIGVPARVEILEPTAGDVFTVQTASDKLTIQVKADFHWANMQVFFSPHEAGSLTPVWIASNYHGGGETKTIQFAMPQVNSPYCRVFVKAKLDNFTEKEYVSDYFTIQLDAPSDLYAFTVDESRVGLDWKCGTLLGFEVQRRLKNTSTWEVIGTGYWGPGSKSFYDEDALRDTVYYYRVRSFGIFQSQTFYSDFTSAIAVHTPLINAPYAELRVHSPASDRVIVQFLDRSNVETSFELERKCPETGEIWHVEATLPAAPQGGWQIYQDNNVKPESTYFYRSRAYTSTPPAGYSGYTGVYGVTVVPHLKTSRDSATAFQPKMLYDQNTNVYWMSYSAESLLLASRSLNGLDWEGVITACYWGQAMDEKDAGFCQLDLKENGLPVMVFSYLCDS